MSSLVLAFVKRIDLFRPGKDSILMKTKVILLGRYISKRSSFSKRKF